MDFFPTLIQVGILIPSMFSGTTDNLWEVVTGSVGKYPVVSMNAFNIWDFVLSGNLMEIKDDKIFLGQTYKQLGLYMFLVSSGLALFPMLKSCWFTIVRSKEFNVDKSAFLITCALIPLLFFISIHRCMKGIATQHLLFY